jgi:hypothetical protein
MVAVTWVIMILMRVKKALGKVVAMRVPIGNQHLHLHPVMIQVLHLHPVMIQVLHLRLVMIQVLHHRLVM